MPDLRLDADYFGNVKIRRLQRRLADAGVLAHLRLLCYARKFRPDGELRGFTPEDIAVAAEWGGDSELFCQTLSELILIERSEAGHWRIHDWLIVNEWAAGTAGRRAHAQKLNHKRWYLDRKIACADAQCGECAPLRGAGSVATSQVSLSRLNSESVKESTCRDVTENVTRRPVPAVEERERPPADARPREAVVEPSPKRLDWLVEQVRQFDDRAEKTGLFSQPDEYATEFKATIGYTPNEWERIREGALQ